MAVDQTQYPMAMAEDPDTGKPMPKSAVQLTGRNVTVASVQNLTVAAGTFVVAIPETQIKDFGEVYGYATTKDAGHSLTFYLVPRHKLSDGSYQNADANIQKTGTLQYANSGLVGVVAPYYRISFQNNDTVSHTYDFVIGGIK